MAALGILLFHHKEWYLGRALYSDEFLCNVGIYGVAFFFMISGFTLRHIYSPENFQIKRYFISRVLRIYPLMILCVLFFYALNPGNFGLSFLWEISGIQGFLNSSAYQPIWLWSIGTELCFYVLFPVLIWLEKQNIRLLYLLFAGILILQITVFWNIRNWENTWYWYTHPAFNVLYFITGYVLNTRNWSKRKVGNLLSPLQLKILFWLMLFIFLLWPGSHNEKYTWVNGQYRVASFLMMTIIFSLGINLFSDLRQNIFNRWAVGLGLISYGVYALHPLVFHVWTKILTYYLFADIVILGLSLNNVIWFTGSVVFTLLLSILSWKYIESKIMAWKKRL